MAQLFTSMAQPFSGQPSLKDHVAPFKLALIIVIEEYVKNERKPAFERERYSEGEERRMLLLLLQLIQSSDLELKELMFKLSEIDKPRLVESVTQRLQSLREEGVGGVMDLLTGLGDAMFAHEPDQQPLLHKSSVIGLFMRRMMLAFEVLTFQEVTKVYKAYKVFLDSWRNNANDSSLTEHAANDTSNFDTSMSMEDFSRGEHQLFDESRNTHQSPDGALPAQCQSLSRHSQKQAEFFIAQQTTLLQHNEMQALTPKQMQQKISELLTNNPDMAEVHYLSYLNNLRVNEYCTALESLYHYFDRQQTLSGPSQGAAAAAARGKPDGLEEGASRGFRYAALNLASLHYRFGHRTEALAAIQESIRVAQESNDHVCLQHALTWLHRLGVQRTGSTAYLLDRLVTKSADSNLPYLSSLGVQAFAKHNAVSTADQAFSRITELLCKLISNDPRHGILLGIFEFVTRSDLLNCQHSQSDLLCVSYAQKSALWHMYGNREMCSLNSQLLLNLNTSDLGIFHNAEAECLGLCHLARLHSDQGDYESAFEIMLCTKLRFPANSKYCQIWMQQEHLLYFRRALQHGNHSAAEQAIFNLASVNSLEAKLCRCILTHQKGETTEAFDLLQSLLGECAANRNQPVEQPHFYARLLLLKAELLYSLGVTSQAVAPLLECLALCEAHHFARLSAVTTLHLAFVQYLLGIPFQALKILKRVLLSVFAHGSLFDRARAQLLWIKCEVACSKHQESAQRQAVLSNCVQTLDDVIRCFEKIESHRRKKDALYLQARLYDTLGRSAERNKSALQFRELDQLYPSWHQTIVCVL